MQPESWPNVRAAVAFWLLTNFALVGIFDVMAAWKWGPEATVSYQIWYWSRRMPIMPFVVGLLCGHLFWRTYNGVNGH